MCVCMLQGGKVGQDGSAGEIQAAARGEGWTRPLTLRARLLTVRVSAALKPSMCVPPSAVRIELTNPSIVSEYASEHHCSETDTVTPVARSDVENETGACSGVRSRFSHCTYCFRPPVAWNTCHLWHGEGVEKECGGREDVGQRSGGSRVRVHRERDHTTPRSTHPCSWSLCSATKPAPLPLPLLEADAERAAAGAATSPSSTPEPAVAAPAATRTGTPFLVARNRMVAVALRNDSSRRREPMVSGSKTALRFGMGVPGGDGVWGDVLFRVLGLKVLGAERGLLAAMEQGLAVRA